MIVMIPKDFVLKTMERFGLVDTFFSFYNSTYSSFFKVISRLPDENSTLYQYIDPKDQTLSGTQPSDPYTSNNVPLVKLRGPIIDTVPTKITGDAYLKRIKFTENYHFPIRFSASRNIRC